MAKDMLDIITLASFLLVFYFAKLKNHKLSIVLSILVIGSYSLFLLVFVGYYNEKLFIKLMYILLMVFSYHMMRINKN